MNLLASVKKNDEYFEEIQPNVWLMDDHKWAYFIWEQYRHNKVDLPSTLVHIDYHWDAVNDFQNKESVKSMEECNLKKLKQIIRSDLLIRKDSFIAPAIIKKFFKKIYFFCLQKDTEQGFYKPFLSEYDASESIFSDIESLCKELHNNDIILDLDLDIFNKSGKWAEGDLWAEEEIISFLGKCSTLVNNAKIITIAMSFDYSGTQDDTMYLTHLTVANILDQLDRNRTTNHSTGFAESRR